MSDKYQLVVIGAGPGGYVAAIRAAQLGMNVAIIEKEDTLGGTCLNWGCIPSKALLDSSEKYYEASNHFDVHGIGVTELKLNFKKMMARKKDVVLQTTKGIDYLMSKNKITRLLGTASFVGKDSLMVSNSKGEISIQADHIIIASGSEVTPLESVPVDGKQIITSTEALSLEKLPKSLVIIGGGVIGVEMGSIYARLGTKVTVVEYMDRLLPTMDAESGKALQKSLKKIGVNFSLKTRVTGVSKSKKFVTLHAEDSNSKEINIESEIVLVAIGRRPYTERLGLDSIGIKVNERGCIPVNERFETSVKGVYAIGDVIGGAMLAHKASEEGVACVEGIAGKAPFFNPHTIPGVVYTWPEVASVGFSEEQLKEKKVAYKKGSFPFKASGRARAAEESDGFIKVLADEATDEVLGIHMVGPRAADMISEAVLAMEYRASAQDIGMIIHAHPTYSEVLKEAALMAHDKHPIHI